MFLILSCDQCAIFRHLIDQQTMRLPMGGIWSQLREHSSGLSDIFKSLQLFA